MRACSAARSWRSSASGRSDAGALDGGDDVADVAEAGFEVGEWCGGGEVGDVVEAVVLAEGEGLGFAALQGVEDLFVGLVDPLGRERDGAVGVGSFDGGLGGGGVEGGAVAGS